MATRAPKTLSKIRRKKGLEGLNRAIANEQDIVMVILRAHLLTENLLEQLILAGLSRGDRILDEGNLTYYQKLILTAALDLLPDPIISSLRNLNKVRNDCAHQLEKTITENDVSKIGTSLGKKFVEIRHEANFDDLTVLRHLLYYVVGAMSGTLHGREARQIVVHKKKRALKESNK